MVRRGRVSIVEHGHIAEVERDGVNAKQDLSGGEFSREVFSGELDVFAVFGASEYACTGGKRHDVEQVKCVMRWRSEVDDGK